MMAQAHQVDIDTAIDMLTTVVKSGCATTIRFIEDLWQLLEREAQRQGVSAAPVLASPPCLASARLPPAATRRLRVEPMGARM
jgi:hypothetical protein